MTPELYSQKVVPKKEWKLHSQAFVRLLRWLDQGSDSGGQKYLETCRRLVGYFDRKGCSAPEDLADETLNRVARRVEEEGTIESEIPAKYCYIMARFVFLEYLRGREKEETLRRQLQPSSSDALEDQDSRVQRERMLDCLDQCTGKLDSTNHELILRYYFGRERVKIENRRALADSLGISMNALSIRACRIRDKLEVCVSQCVNEAK